MLWTEEQRRLVGAGVVTVSFRVWKRAQVVGGRRYRLNAVHDLEVLSVDEVELTAIEPADALAAGYPAIAAAVADATRRLARAGEAAKLFRVRFRLSPAAARPAPTVDAGTVVRRLQRMDTTNADGAWTHAVLALIGKHPHTAASLLAREVGMEKAAFKARVRRVKLLGLTVSYEIGYDLTAAGRQVLQQLETESGTATP
ncbi:MAG: hypothetical protein ACR2HN_06400 [Tepidiformaceae bacterium]